MPCLHSQRVWLPAGLVLAYAVVTYAWGGWFALSKLMGFVLMPVGLLWLLLAAGICCARGAARWQCLMSFVLLTLAGNTWLSAWLVARWEAPYAQQDPFAVQSLDAVWVLGGGSIDAPYRGQLGHAGDRIALAAELWQRGSTPLLVSSGTSVGIGATARDLGPETQAIWQSWGVPATAVLSVAGASHTRAEIVQLKQEAAARGWKRVGLCTSAWHLRRALSQLDHPPCTVLPLAADIRGILPPASPLLLVPQIQGLELTSLWAWEVLGMLAGR